MIKHLKEFLYNIILNLQILTVRITFYILDVSGNCPERDQTVKLISNIPHVKSYLAWEKDPYNRLEAFEYSGSRLLIVDNKYIISVNMDGRFKVYLYDERGVEFFERVYDCDKFLSDIPKETAREICFHLDLLKPHDEKYIYKFGNISPSLMTKIYR